MAYKVNLKLAKVVFTLYMFCGLVILTVELLSRNQTPHVEVVKPSVSMSEEFSPTLLGLHPLHYTKEDLYYMTEAIYFEARSEPLDCQAKVAMVIQHRFYSHKYPNRYREVVWQYKQFSYTHDGKSELMVDGAARAQAEAIAELVLGGYLLDTTEGSLYYFNPELANPVWKDDYEYVVSCAKHDFYKTKTGKRGQQ